MFCIKQTSTYTWPVKIEIPSSGGTFEKQNFDGEFKRIPESRIKEIGKLVDAGEITDLDLAKEILVGWKGIGDESGNEVQFSETMKETVLDMPLVARAVVTAFFNSQAGAKRKN